MKILVGICILAVLGMACSKAKDGTADSSTNQAAGQAVIDPATISEDNAEKMADDILKEVEAL